MRHLALPAALLLATPALAHHPLGGLPMETFGDGLLSGVGHPLLGFDHLFFVIAMGALAAFTPAPRLAPLGYIAAMLLGCVVAAAGLALPLTETLIVVSLIAIGAVLVHGQALGLVPAVALFAGFGLFHGVAFGGSVAEAEGGAGAAVLIGYLLGLGVLQYAIAIGAGMLAKASSGLAPRMAGAAVAGVGVFLALEIVEGPIVAALAG